MKRTLLPMVLLWIGSSASWCSVPTTTFINPTPGESDRFGTAVVAVGPDHVLIGAPGDDADGESVGAAYLLTLGGTPITTFHGPNPTQADYFGAAVAAMGTDRVVIGDPSKDVGAANAGAAYLFSTNGTLLASFHKPAPQAGDSLGSAVASLGTDRVLIAAEGDDTGARDAGAVYLFSTDGTLLTTFNNPTPQAGDNFGSSIAVVGNDRVLIGARQDDTGARDAGAAYLFSTKGTLLTTFTNPKPWASDHFGASVAALGNDLVVIGARDDDTGATDAGQAYLFATDGRLVTTFANPTPSALDHFGSSLVGIGTDQVLISAQTADTDALDAGAVYLFRADGTLLVTFTQPNPRAQDYFGSALATVRGHLPLIGAYGESTGAQGSGAAYLFPAYDGRPNAMTLTATGAGPGQALLKGWVNPNGAEPTGAWFEWGTSTRYGNSTSVTNVGTGSAPVFVALPATPLTPGVLHHFRIVASNAFGMVTGPDLTFPFPFPMAWTEPPSPVAATSATLHATVQPDGWPVTAWFTWRNAAGNGADQARGTVFHIAARTNAVPLSQPVTGLLPGQSYLYELQVTNGAFASSHSGSFTTPQPPIPITSSASGSTPTNTTLNGAVNPNSLPTRSWFEWGTTTNYGNATVPVEVDPGTASHPVSATIGQLSGLTDYHYRLVVSNAAGVFRGNDQVASTPTGRTLNGYYITPTLVPANTHPKYPTPIRVTALGNNRFPTQRDWRVRLTRNGQPITADLELASIKSTNAVLYFPSVDTGFYGFVIQSSNTVTHVWESLYESGPRFFQVGEDATASTYSPVPRGEWTEPTQPNNFVGTKPSVITGTLYGWRHVRHQVEPRFPPLPPWEHMDEYENCGLLHLGWTKDFPGDGEDLAGIQLDFHFPLEDEVVYTCEVPFRLLLDCPTNVYAGQEIELKVRDFQFNGGTLTAEHDLAFRTYHRLWVNAPYDFAIPPVDNEHSFERDRLMVWGELPVAPLLTMSYGPLNSRELPWSEIPGASWFDDGRVTAAEIGGVPVYESLPDYLKSRLSFANITLGGGASYSTRGDTNRFWYGPHEIWTRGPDDGWQPLPELWYANVDMIGLVYASSIPYYSQAAAPLFFVGVELGLNCGVTVRARDAVHLKPPLTHGLKLRIPANASGSLTLATNLTLPIDATFLSQYLYRLWGGVYFDMPRIRRKDLSWSDDDFWRPEVTSSVTLAATFTLNQTFSVTNRAAWMKEFVLPAFSPLRGAPAGTESPDTDYDLVASPPAQADEERRWIGNMSFRTPPPPPMVPQVIRGTFPDEDTDGRELMVSANPPAGAAAILLDPPPTQGGYSNGSVVTATAQPRRGYRFAGWSGDLSSRDNPATITLDADKTVVANFSTATLSDIGILPDGSVRFSVKGFTGLGWLVQSTTNLATPNWVPVTTNTSPFTFTHPNAGRDPQRFYRLLLLP